MEQYLGTGGALDAKGKFKGELFPGKMVLFFYTF